MPQLDKVTFLSQFFWLCFFYLGFYIVILKYFLPQMTRILKYRKKKMSQSHQGVTSMQQENDNVRTSCESLLENSLKSGKHIFKKNLQCTESWLSDVVKSTNEASLQKTNYAYLYSLGEKSLSQNLSLQYSFFDFSDAIFLSTLSQKLNNLSDSKNLLTQEKHLKNIKKGF